MMGKISKTPDRAKVCFRELMRGFVVDDGCQRFVEPGCNNPPVAEFVPGDNSPAFLVCEQHRGKLISYWENRPGFVERKLV